ncbi:Fur-regulated basic protein A [Halobacillus dabanensis]|uniref:Fur-regulated basic protein A n=1 Tax=Halobacillus dabanensis TaxID=240302 RepID=A0A1I3TTT7_HALDA|nr:Fur-regulated basic protein FbpA [Halobacillus dabanensis]SFJ74678.1 Fur-regulated basic protein A [Halobacillus dabanensis]
MKNHLRNAVESMKEHYIQKLIQAGMYQASDDSLKSLTLTELEALVARIKPSKGGTTPPRGKSDVII